jgi:hypothetical protein
VIPVLQGLFLLENSDNGVAGSVLTREHSDNGCGSERDCSYWRKVITVCRDYSY